MKVIVAGATGLIGTRLVGALKARGDVVGVLSRSPARASEALGVPATGWDPLASSAPAEALAGADAVVNLTGEPVAQRWTAAVKEQIRASRELGTRRLVSGIAAADPSPPVLVSSSAAGYYGDRGDEELTESAPPGDDFLARVCVDWEAAAAAAADGVTVTLIRTGVVLDKGGGALAKMLPPFKAGVGGPVAGGKQWMSWIALDDLVSLYLAAIDGGPAWSGPLNGCAPAPVRNAEFSKTLGKVLHRPAVAPVPRFALRALFGEMGTIVTASQRMVPARALELGFQFRYRELEPALRAALG